MSYYILDTHILLWWLSDDKRLTKKIRDLISDPSNRIIVSVVTVWEIVIKKSLGKLDAPDNLKEAIDADDFEVLSVTIDHALYLQHLPAIHNDPFDRLLIAQCIVEDLVLITADEIIPKYDVECF